LTLEHNTKRMFEFVQIPENYWEDRLSRIQEGPHKAVILDWFEDLPININEGKGLYLYGEYGVGKSSIAAMLLKGALAHGKFGLWTNFKPLPQYYKSPKDYMFDGYSSMFQKMLSTPILVVDELAVAPKDWWPIEIFEEVIRTRVQKRLSTIITSNHPPTYFTDGLERRASKDEKKIADITQGLISILTEAVDSCHVIGEDLRKV